MKKYEFLLFDADNTLLDFDANESVSIRVTLKKFGIEPTDEMVQLYSGINRKYWRMYDEGVLTQAQVLIKRFEELFEVLGIEHSPREAENYYRAQLGLGNQVIPGALELLGELQGKFRMAIVTNGVVQTQYPRLRGSGLDVFFEKMFISEEVGFHKPEKGYFDYVFSHMEGFQKDKALIIGDSLSSDIKGGMAAGIDTCYFDRRRVGSGNVQPTFTVHDFDELRVILGI